MPTAEMQVRDGRADYVVGTPWIAAAEWQHPES